ncbi:hypothetical protein M9H77_06404 [Catharanthus roseus]|uniref:Uncharacterized protein n=1 Tax=Catharanthus roseus TaxID=4058 RepID=A0ACC0BS19_CATRO|nr:hypothetical protein M9H77_06404 [Catharanthus roseus]
MFQDLVWHVLEKQREDLRGAETLLLSKVQVEESKETSLEDFEATKLKGEEDLNPTVGGKVLNVLIMCGWKSNQGEYVRYHESYSYDAHNQGGNANGGINHSSTNFTPRRQDSVGNFSPYARSFKHASYNYYEENRLRVGNGISYRHFEKVPRKETRNEENYVNMDESLEWSQAMGNSKGEQEMYISSQGIVKKETKKSSIVEESQRAIELLQVKEVVGALDEYMLPMKILVISRGKRAWKKRRIMRLKKKNEWKEKRA